MRSCSNLPYMLVATFLIVLTTTSACAGSRGSAPADSGGASPNRQFEPDPREKHFSTLTMLTSGGENAEAYFSYDGTQLVFQSTRPPYDCDQILVVPVAGGDPQLVSTGKGRTTCAYFTGGDKRIIYASTHLADVECPTPPDMSQGYVWALYPGFDIFSLDLQGNELIQLTDTPGYDAEATVSPAGDKIVFTSVRDGDLDIYTMNLDGSDVKRLTDTEGYDGGPFFSPDGSMIVYRAHHPSEPDALKDYQVLLANHKVRPSRMEIWVMDVNGENQRQITNLGCASFAPFFHPSGRKIIFSSNHPTPRSREFELFMVDLDGDNLEQVTFSEQFDGFPMWASDGETFVFCSNRHNAKPGETNIFLTKWKD